MTEWVEPIARLDSLDISKNSLNLLLLIFVELCRVISTCMCIVSWPKETGIWRTWRPKEVSSGFGIPADIRLDTIDIDNLVRFFVCVSNELLLVDLVHGFATPFVGRLVQFDESEKEGSEEEAKGRETRECKNNHDILEVDQACPKRIERVYACINACTDASLGCRIYDLKNHKKAQRDRPKRVLRHVVVCVRISQEA